MQSIQVLDNYKIASFNLKDNKTDEGTIETITLDGTRYGIYNFEDYEYELKLEYLTEAELEGIKTEFNYNITNNLKPTFPVLYLKQFDFILNGPKIADVNFIIEKKNFKQKNSKLPKLYNLNIIFTQRVVL